MTEAIADKYQACLLGLAIGDALGAPVEFLSLNEIKQHYGERGISEFQAWGGFKPGSYTDDTQMSLATAVGCIRAHQRGNSRGVCYPPQHIYVAYLEWLETQKKPEFRRAPGNTCLAALHSGLMGTLEGGVIGGGGEVEGPINHSKGCGGVMRTAPAGLAFPPGDAFREGASYAIITHGHPSGYLPAGFLSEMVPEILDGETLEYAIRGSMRELTAYGSHEETLRAVELACDLSMSERSPDESIAAIGQGWVGEEALAIALYCALKFPDDWSAAVLTSVNHSGDSDSTGCITGAILGTLLGKRAISSHWIDQVENSALIHKIADDMFKIVRNGERLTDEEYTPKLMRGL